MASNAIRPAYPASRGAGARVVGVIFCLAAAAASVSHYVIDRRERAPALRFVETFQIDERRPSYAQSIHLAPTADTAYALAADAALRDATGSVRLSEIEPAKRALWLEAMGRIGEELVAARAMLLDALRTRPGWPLHQALLAMVEHAVAADRADGSRAKIWVPLLVGAIEAAPADRTIADFAAYAIASSWETLDDATRAHAPAIFRTALRDPAFVESNYPLVVDAVGAADAERFLPEIPLPLRAARQLAVEQGDVAAAARLQARWERAERIARQEDLRRLEERARFGDEQGLQGACATWAELHSAFDFDDAAARRQVARVLELWPALPGSWIVDRRAELVQYFFNGRMEAIDPAVLVRTLDALTDVPAPVAARAALAAGDTYRAEQLAGQAEASGSFEWTPFYVDYAWQRFRAGDAEGAAVLLGRIPSSAWEECEVALVRRAVFNPGGAPRPGGSGVLPRSYPPEFWSPSGVPICIDPAAGHRWLAVVVDAGTDALVAVGFDAGRSRTAVLPRGRTRLRLPLAGRSGRHFFSYQVVAGGEVQPALATLE